MGQESAHTRACQALGESGNALNVCGKSVVRRFFLIFGHDHGSRTQRDRQLSHDVGHRESAVNERGNDDRPSALLAGKMLVYVYELVRMEIDDHDFLPRHDAIRISAHSILFEVVDVRIHGLLMNHLAEIRA